MLQTIKNKLIYFIKQFFIFLIVGLRPLMGPSGSCRFTFTCTQHAIFQIQNEPLHKALWSIIKRLLICRPFYKSTK